MLLIVMHKQEAPQQRWLPALSAPCSVSSLLYQLPAISAFLLYASICSFNCLAVATSGNHSNKTISVHTFSVMLAFMRRVQTSLLEPRQTRRTVMMTTMTTMGTRGGPLNGNQKVQPC